MNKKRVYIDIDEDVHEKVKELAHDARLPLKRYVEELFNQLAAKAKGGKPPKKP